MPATGRSARAWGMAAFVVAMALPLLADAHADVVNLVANLASALTEVNVPAFMDEFDKDMPGYAALRDQVTGLVNQAEVTSSIESVRDEGDDAHRSVDLDWYLEVRSLRQAGQIVRRREVVRCELRKESKKWKIVALKPADFFAPAKLEQ